MIMMNVSKRKTELAAAALLAIMLVQIIYVITSTSQVLDEQFYPGVGKYTLTTGDFSPFAYRFHPPLAYYINSIFLYTDNNPVWNEKPFDMANIISVYGIDNYLFLTRLPIAVMSLVLGIFIFVWARKLYGNRAALFSLVLFCFEPTIIANSAVATTDMAAATFIFIAMYFFWKMHIARGMKNTALAGIFLGLALLSKFTALILLPVAFFMILYLFRKNRIKTIIIYFVAAFFLIWMFYGFQIATINSTVHSTGKSQEFINEAFSGSEKATINSFMNVPLPAASYFTALGYNVYHSFVGHGAYLFGQYSMHGWFYYYILAFAVKAAIPLMLLIAIFAIFSIVGKMKFSSEEKFILLAILVFFVFLSLLKLNIGLRHLLPIYPFVFVILGKLLKVKISRKNIYYAVLALLSIWVVAEALLIMPYNMSYFNEFVGPKNGYKYLSDPDVDWGQWLKYAASYEKEKNITSIYMTAPLPDALTKQYIVDYTRPSCSPKNGIYFVSVSSLILYDHFNDPSNCLQWLRDRTYQDMIGYSVLVYNVTDTSI
jgi:4-amino-4-deoxy-L-arabinose transferase-like glycosyltransferase